MDKCPLNPRASQVVLFPNLDSLLLPPGHWDVGEGVDVDEEEEGVWMRHEGQSQEGPTLLRRGLPSLLELTGSLEGSWPWGHVTEGSGIRYSRRFYSRDVRWGWEVQCMGWGGGQLVTEQKWEEMVP